jgi:hypothetical protein
MANYEDELATLGPLAPTAIALVRYATALVPGAEFVQKGRRWVCQPENFVAFAVHSSRSRHVTFNLSGRPHLFEKSPALRLEQARASYSEFRLEAPRQLAAAASYIATALLIHRHRKHSLPDLPALSKRL